jgi:rhodanese-related sulfurtransferase
MVTKVCESAKVCRTERKNFAKPDGTRELPRTKLEWIDLEGLSAVKVTLEPGWRWSEHIRPTLKTESCQQSHLQYVLSGHLRVIMDDGEQIDLEPGDFVRIPPGHDAWVLGEEPFCALDITGFRELRGPRMISPECAHELLKTDPAAILVCGYEEEEEFRRHDLEGALSLAEFRRRIETFPKDESVVFYCACPHDETAIKRATEYFQQGFVNARILEGGVEAWRKAGYGLVKA